MEGREILSFPVWIIPFPVCKTGKYFIKEVFKSEIWKSEKYPFPVCNIGFGLVSKNGKYFAKEVF